LHVLPRNVESTYISDRLVNWTNFELRRLIPQEARLWTTATILVEAGEVVDRILAMADEVRLGVLS
jgi:hypothetical protein